MRAGMKLVADKQRISFCLALQGVRRIPGERNASCLVAMQRADKNTDKLLEGLNSRFHRLRHGGIGEELFDVISGFEALTGPPQPMLPERAKG